MLAGGKSPLIICDDVADLDEAVDIAHAAIFNNHGQNCCAGSRTFVQAGIYEDFVAKAKAKAQSRTIGDPWTKYHAKMFSFTDMSLLLIKLI